MRIDECTHSFIFNRKPTNRMRTPWCGAINSERGWWRGIPEPCGRGKPQRLPGSYSLPHCTLLIMVEQWTAPMWPFGHCTVGIQRRSWGSALVGSVHSRRSSPWLCSSPTGERVVGTPRSLCKKVPVVSFPVLIAPSVPLRCGKPTAPLR